MEYYSAVKTTLLHARAWFNLNNHADKIIQTQKNPDCMIPFMLSSRAGKVHLQYWNHVSGGLVIA